MTGYNLAPRFVLGDLDLTWAPFMVEFGSDAGAPENVYEVLEWLLADGEAVSSDRTSNREMEISVLIEAPDYAGLAECEAALIAECDKPRNTLLLDPGDGFGPPSVFEVFRIQVTQNPDRREDLEAAGLRRWTLTIPAQPFVRSVEEVVAEAEDDGGVEPVTEVFDDGTSLSGWTGAVGGSSATVTGPPPTVTPTVLRRNLIPNPRLLTTSTWQTGASGSTLTPVSGGMRIRVNGPAQTRLTMLNQRAAAMPVTAGISYTARAVLSSPQQVASGARLKVRWFNAAGDTISDSNGPALSANPTGTTAVTATAPTGAVLASWWFEGKYATPSINPYAQITVSKPQFSRTDEDGPFFTGADATADGFAYAWEHGADSSASLQLVAGVSELTRSGLVEFGDTPYLHVDHVTNGRDPILAAPVVTLDGSEPLTLTEFASLGFGKFRSVYLAGEDVSVNSIAFAAGTEGAAAPGFSVLHLSRSNMNSGFTATGRQKSRTIAVYGSARTQGRLALQHSTQGLGKSLAYVSARAGSYRPPLDPFYLSGGVAAPDSTTSTGRRLALTSGDPATYGVPMSNLTAGDYAVLARTRATGSAGTRSIYATLSTQVDATTLGTSDGEWTDHMEVDWDVRTIGNLYPVDPMKHPTGTLFVYLESDQVDLDNVWLINTTTGSLVRVDCGERRRLWIDTPTTEHPYPTIWLGNIADRSDAFHAPMDSIDAWDEFVFTPGPMDVFTVCEAVNASVSLRHFPRWHTHAAPVKADS